MNGKKSNFLGHFLVIGLGTIIKMFLGLLTTPIITRLVDPTEYGQLSIFDMYTSMAVMVLCLGLDQSLVRFFYSDDSEDYKQKLVKTCAGIPLFVAIPLAGIFLLLVRFNIINFEFSYTISIFLAINVIVTLWNRFAILVLRLSYKSKLYSACSVLQKIVYIIIAVPGTYFFDNKLMALILATVLSLVVPSIVAMLAEKNIWKISGFEILDNRKNIIKYGLPFILSMGITTVFQALDKISLNMYCSYSEVGIYSSTMTIVSILGLIQTTFNAVWAPMQTEHYVTNPDDPSFIQKGNKYVTILMFFVGLTLIFCKDIFALLLGEKYREAAYILPFLIFNPIMYTLSETTCSGIEKSEKSYLNIITAGAACGVNFIGNTCLVPLLACKGAAISTGISYIVFFVMRTFFSNREYYIDYQLRKTAVITSVTIINAAYNTFFKFGVVSIILYIISILSFIGLYWKDIKELFYMTKGIINKKLHYRS